MGTHIPIQSFFHLLCLILVTRATSDLPLPSPSEHGIIELTPQNWDQVVMNEAHHVIVEFYSPFCSYCQQLVPVWNELGEKFKKENSIIIAKIDYSFKENQIPAFSVRGVPTILLFPKNNKKKSILFQQERTLHNFIAW